MSGRNSLATIGDPVVPIELSVVKTVGKTSLRETLYKRPSTRYRATQGVEHSKATHVRLAALMRDLPGCIPLATNVGRTNRTKCGKHFQSIKQTKNGRTSRN